MMNTDINKYNTVLGGNALEKLNKVIAKILVEDETPLNIGKICLI